MAKGRKLTTSQSERFLGSYAYGNGHGYLNAGEESPELGEEDVWSMVEGISPEDEAKDDDDNDNRSLKSSSRSEWETRAAFENGGGTGSIPIRSRRGGGEERRAGGLSLAFECSGKTASSPRILHQFHHRGGAAQSPRGGQQMATSAPVNVPDWSKIYRVDSVESLHDSDDGLDEQSEMVPPHEYLARGRRTGTTSVFEGVGRTLKGRDLRRIRDAVWSQTGFDG